MLPLSVLFCSDAPYEGGAERYLAYLAGALPSRLRLSAVVPAAPALSAFARRLSAHGVVVERGGPGGALAGAIRRQRPDIVHLNLPHPYAMAHTAPAFLARALGVGAVVTTEHLPMVGPMRFRGRFRRFATARAVDRIITLTDSNRRALVERHGVPPERVRVIPNGVPDAQEVPERERALARAALGHVPGVPLFVMIGALDERKGHDVLFAAIARPLGPAFRVAIVGEGERRPALEAAVREAGIGDRVSFAGWRDDVPAVLAVADAIVLPSRAEGMPLVLLEALAAGVPAVVTGVDGVPEIYAGSEAGVLVPPDDPDALGAALAALAADPTRRHAMGMSARCRYLERHTDRAMGAATARVYEEVTGRCVPNRAARALEVLGERT